MSLELQSEKIDALMFDFLKAKALIDHAHKDALNGHVGNRYAKLEAVIDAVTDPLGANCLLIVQSPTIVDGVRLLATTLYHKSGQWLRSYTEIIPDNNKNPAQAAGSGLTYARRYALAAICGIGQEDLDADSGRTNTTPPPAQQPPQATAPRASNIRQATGAQCCGAAMKPSQYKTKDGKAQVYCAVCKKTEVA